MPVLPDRAGCQGNSVRAGETTTSQESTGWEEVGDFVQHQNLDYKLVKLANKKVSLYSALNKYHVQLEQVYSATGWSHRSRCPFPDHNDRSPSFGYNSNEDRFNCFGCHRGGKAVEFIAAMDGRTKISVARDLIGSSMSSDEIASIDIEEFDYRRLRKALFEYADILRAFKRAHNNSPEAIQYAKDVTWNLDVYLRKHAPFNTIVLEDLEIRISKLKDQLQLFED
jgi:hypothetical protein